MEELLKHGPCGSWHRAQLHCIADEERECDWGTRYATTKLSNAAPIWWQDKGKTFMHNGCPCLMLAAFNSTGIMFKVNIWILLSAYFVPSSMQSQPQTK